MAVITQIKVTLGTGDRSGAGTDSRVYVGIGGREFNIDSRVDDFGQATVRTYVLRKPPEFATSPDQGLLPEERSVKHPKHNDPSSDYPIDSSFLPLFPVYVRFEPRVIAGMEETDNWNLKEVRIDVFTGDQPFITFNGLGSGQNIWLGMNYGKIIYLPNVAKLAPAKVK